MKTKITYSCKKHDVWNGKKWTKSINRLGGRAFEVTVSGCKTLEECESVLASEDVMGVYKEWKKEYFKRSSK